MTELSSGEVSGKLYCPKYVHPSKLLLLDNSHGTCKNHSRRPVHNGCAEVDSFLSPTRMQDVQG